MNERRVVVTGLGMVSPVGNDVASSWKACVNGQSGIDYISAFDASACDVKVAAEVKNFDSSSVIEAKERGRMSRFCQFAIVATDEAIRDSGLKETGFTPERAGVLIGVGLGDLPEIARTSVLLDKAGARKVSPFFIPYIIPNMASGLISRNYNLKGPTMCTTTACASGTHAVGEAFLYIKSGLTDVMVAGGSESTICPLGVIAFSNMKALSKRADDPTKVSRPFDRDRDGFVIGEGSGVVILEEYEHAKRRGARIYAELVGYGLSGDAHHITAPAPQGEGGQRCMRMAFEMSSTPLDQLDYINAHGTSTKLNDQFESEAIGILLGDHAKDISISSTKSVTGHCLGAAGGLEAVFSVLAIHNSLVPPTVNYENQDPDCLPLDYTPLKAKERPIRYALSNSFGFGGTNASLLFKKV